MNARITSSAALFAALFCSSAIAQTTAQPTGPAASSVGATPSQACAAIVTYQYFAEAGITYGSVPQYTTGFGVRVGCSNAFVTIDFDSIIGQPFNAYSTARAGIKYVIAAKGFWSLSSFAAAGATTSGSVSFAGGGGLAVDLGSWLTKGKVPLLVEGQFRATAVPATTSGQVAKSAGVMVLKVF